LGKKETSGAESQSGNFGGSKAASGCRSHRQENLINLGKQRKAVAVSEGKKGAKTENRPLMRCPFSWETIYLQGEPKNFSAMMGILFEECRKEAGSYSHQGGP